MLSQKQIDLHYSSIGGSFASAIMGFNKYTSPLDVYLLLTDNEYRKKNQEEVGDKLCVKLGNYLESFVANEAASAKKWNLVTARKTFTHPIYNFLTANVDRFILSPGKENEGLEIKTRSIYKAKEYGEEDTDRVLDEELYQCQHYMSVTGLKKWNLAVLLGNQEIKYFTIDRNDELIGLMQAEEIRFWNENYLARKPPEPRTAEQAALLYPQSIFGKTVKATPEIESVFASYKEEKEKEKAAKKNIETHKDKIACYMKDNETLLDNTGKTLLTYSTQTSQYKATEACEKTFKVMRIK